jgi:hypothetical protein
MEEDVKRITQAVLKVLAASGDNLAIYEAVKAALAAAPAVGGEREALMEQTIRDSIEALERNSTSAPVVECLKAALSSASPEQPATLKETL